MILLAKCSTFCSTIRVASQGSLALEVLFMQRPSLGFSKDGIMSRCPRLLSSFIYGHKHSAPSEPASPLYSERHAPFSPSVSPEEIFHVHHSLFSQATNLVATCVHREIDQFSCTNVPGNKNHLRASTNCLGTSLVW